MGGGGGGGRNGGARRAGVARDSASRFIMYCFCQYIPAAAPDSAAGCRDDEIDGGTPGGHGPHHPYTRRKCVRLQDSGRISESDGQRFPFPVAGIFPVTSALISPAPITILDGVEKPSLLVVSDDDNIKFLLDFFRSSIVSLCMPWSIISVKQAFSLKMLQVSAAVNVEGGRDRREKAGVRRETTSMMPPPIGQLMVVRMAMSHGSTRSAGKGNRCHQILRFCQNLAAVHTLNKHCFQFSGQLLGLARHGGTIPTHPAMQSA
ncbi:hypothetical protein B0H11DRAFT_1914781 [Mycena galericulata]|nr:hypothetical protein B0H11DRAFT_1914781 [Mycena galericulata]